MKALVAVELHLCSGRLFFSILDGVKHKMKGLYWKGRFYTSKKTQAERGYTAQIQPHGHPNWIKAMYNSGHTLMNHQQGKAQKSTKEVRISYISLSEISRTKGGMSCKVA